MNKNTVIFFLFLVTSPPPQSHQEHIQQQQLQWQQQDPDPPKEFILPAGGEAAARCHLARTIVRRAERETVTLARHDAVRPEAIRYLNRLSDLLFVLARVANDDGRADLTPEAGGVSAGVTASARTIQPPSACRAQTATPSSSPARKLRAGVSLRISVGAPWDTKMVGIDIALFLVRLVAACLKLGVGKGKY